jgi:Fusaric acid resistance protein-like
MLIRLRLLDPGRVRLRIAIRTIIAAVAALLVADAVSRSADLSGGIVVIATVVAVMVARSLHATTLPHRLSALVYVPAIGVLAALVGRFMLEHTWFGAAAFVASVGGSRYLMRFGGKVRRFGRLALTPLIAVLVTPIPPSAAKSTGPLWGAVAGFVAVACVIAAHTVAPTRPAREAASAAGDFVRAAALLRALPPGSRRHTALARTLHRAALTVEARLDAARLPEGADRAPLDALAAAVLIAEVRAQHEEPAAPGGSDALPDALADALDTVRARAAAVRTIRARQWPTPDPPAPRRRTGGRRDPQPQTRLSAQLVAAMGAAFVVGHVFFAHRWAWTVITAFVVCSAARGRGDVVHRSGLRVAGAFTGAITGTLAAHLVAGDAPAAITLIFCYLLIGLWLRELSYAIWAFCVTSLLAVLYGLNGEQSASLLVQRPEGILLGSACGIAAACFVLPLTTETVMRGRAARALRVLQELLAALREPDPRPTAIRHLARRFDRAAQELASAAAPARAHRALLRRHRGIVMRPLALVSAAKSSAARAPASHPADWADAVAACAHAARALAATEATDLAAARAQLGLTARNLGQVRRRLGRRPDAEPPRPARTGPAHLIRLNTSLAELYDLLPAPAPAPAAPPPARAVAPSAG